MKCRLLSISLVGLVLTTSSLVSLNKPVRAEVTDPQAEALLNQAYGQVFASQDLLQQVEADLQRREAELNYYCYQLGNPQACQELKAMHQRRMLGMEASIQYWQHLKNSGWADGFRTFGDPPYSYYPNPDVIDKY